MRLALAFALALAACGGSTASPPKLANTGGTQVREHVLLASIEGTACFGTCPSYKLTIYRDGAVEYEGEEYVKTKGKATGTLALDKVDAIDRLFAEHGYLKLRDSYESYDVTDNPSTYTSYQPLGGKLKSVRHYHGDMHAPEELSKLEKRLYELAEVERWIGSREERSTDRLGVP